MQWYGAILPRIHAFVPTHTILEIACGHGRWTQFLKDACSSLVAVDLSEKCIRACQERFAGCVHISYFVNDGRSLDMIPDGSVDFVFSFDSLVHAEDSVIEAYVAQLPRILTRDGIAFLHHSNLGEYSRHLQVCRIPILRVLLKRLGILEWGYHWRDPSMTARKMELYAEAHGLKCISQELVTWGTKRALIDCMSTVVRKESPLSRENRVFRNAHFMQEARHLSRLSRLYSAPPRKGRPTPIRPHSSRE